MKYGKPLCLKHITPHPLPPPPHPCDHQTYRPPALSSDTAFFDIYVQRVSPLLTLAPSRATSKHRLVSAISLSDLPLYSLLFRF